MELDIKVQIKEELRKGLIFGFYARPPIGIILGFVGYRNQVLPLMQILSHATWAYIVNANYLQGFIVKFDVSYHLKIADKADRLTDARKWQAIDLDSIQ